MKRNLRAAFFWFRPLPIGPGGSRHGAAWESVQHQP